jgi:inorganic pyrophosphatase
MTERFWSALDTLVREHEIIIDRPKGTTHHRYPEIVYPLDYGYLDGTRTMDGGGIDVWVGSLQEHKVSAIVVTVDLAKKDIEIKVLIGCSGDEKEHILHVHQRGMQAALLLERQEP